jgi:hypothetical protein
LINAQKAVNKTFTVENLPVISTSLAYGIYMVVVSNLRYELYNGKVNNINSSNHFQRRNKQ